MKKLFVIIAVLAMLAAGASVAFASELTDTEGDDYFDEILSARQDRLDELVAEGVLTQEEADAIIERMVENHEDCDCDEDGYCLTGEDCLGLGTYSGNGNFGANGNSDGNGICLVTGTEASGEAGNYGRGCCGR